MATVRRADPADLPALQRIQSAAIAEPWTGLFDLAIGPGPILRVVETDRPIGYAAALVADDLAYVPELAVDPAAQGQGLGSRLLESLCDELAGKGVGRVRLTARAGDDRVRSFYEAHGFEVVDRVTEHFAAGDGVVYERRLQPSGLSRRSPSTGSGD
jgi:ribosomal-protein-alanine N-acetyltransferase